MLSMIILKKHPAEVWKRAVRMVLEQRSEHDSQWVAIQSVPELGLFKLLEHLPFTGPVSAVSVFQIAILFVISAD